MDWQRYIRDFEAHLRLERNLAGNSVMAYLRDVEHLRRYVEHMGIETPDVTPLHIQGLLKELNETGIAVTSQCRFLSGLRTFYRMLVIEDVVAENPASLVDMPKRPQHLPDVLTDEDVTALQSTFDRSLPGPARNYVIVEVLYGCGLRVSELVNLRLSNIYFEEEMLQVFGKGSKERWVPINPHALSLLYDYIHTLRSQLPVQPGEEARALPAARQPGEAVFLHQSDQHAHRIGTDPDHRCLPHERLLSAAPASVRFIRTGFSP